MKLTDKNIEAYLVLGAENKRYISGFTGSNSLVIAYENGGFFATDGRYTLQANQEVKSGFEKVIITAGDSFMEVLKKELQAKGIKRLGFDPNHINLSLYNDYKEALSFLEMVSVPSLVEEKRLCKTEEEINNIKEAVKITDRVLLEGQKEIKEGMTEKELANLLDYYHVKFGGEKPSFDTIVAFGENAALPHATPGDRKLKSGDIITVDFGCFYNGYCSDMTRTFFFGEPKSEELVKIHNIVNEAGKRQMAAVKEGASTKEIDAIGRDYITEQGYGECFAHGTGHGIGLEIHESPRLNTVSDVILKEGMAITIEPGIYVEGLGGVRIENDLIVRKDGAESLNQSDRSYNVLNELNK